MGAKGLVGALAVMARIHSLRPLATYIGAYTHRRHRRRRRFDGPSCRANHTGVVPSCRARPRPACRNWATFFDLLGTRSRMKQCSAALERCSSGHVCCSNLPTGDHESAHLRSRGTINRHAPGSSCSKAGRIGRRSSCNLLVWARSQLKLLFPQPLTRVHMPINIWCTYAYIKT